MKKRILKKKNQISDSIESYFECISSCDINNGNCISKCVEYLKIMKIETFSNFVD